MNTPAAIARIDRITPSPPIAGTNAAKPIRMSQIASNNIPIFFVKLKFTPLLLSFYEMVICFLTILFENNIICPLLYLYNIYVFLELIDYTIARVVHYYSDLELTKNSCAFKAAYEH